MYATHSPVVVDPAGRHQMRHRRRTVDEAHPVTQVCPASEDDLQCALWSS